MQDAGPSSGPTHSAAPIAGIAQGADAEKDPDYGTLPRNAWIAILHNLDVQSRLSIAALRPEFEALNYSDRALRTVRCCALNDDAAITSMLDGERNRHVRVLCLTNCIVANPQHLVACAAMCENLSQLLCVGCPLDAQDLFYLVAQRLRQLVRLEWSLFCKDPARREGASSSSTEFKPFQVRRNALRYMYVEVRCPCDSSFARLLPLLRECSGMRRLHVHTFRVAHAKLVPHCAFFATSAPDTLQEITYTTGKNVRDMCREFRGHPRSYDKIIAMITVCGNATIALHQVRRAPAFDDARHLRRCPVWVERLKPMLITVNASNAAASVLKHLAEGASWHHVRELALVFLPEPVGIRPPRNTPMTCAPLEFKDDIVSFFKAFCAITELNLNAFHFSEELSFPAIAVLSGLKCLRALSVAPCALRVSVYSLEHLGLSCTSLQELDVRSNTSGASSWPCFSCFSGKPFIFSQEGLIMSSCLASLVGASGLQSLTLYKVPGFYSFGFLTTCRVTELRLSGVDAIDPSEFFGIGRRLCANANLRKLTIEHVDLPLESMRMWADLAKLRSLHFLCLLAETRLSERIVVRGTEAFLRTLPLLQGLHLHFEGPTDVEQVRLTWLKKRGGFQEPRQDAGEEREFLTFVGKPCVQCCMTTFIGLQKPRYRECYDFLCVASFCDAVTA